MATLQSPGVDVEIINESFYSGAGPGTVPLFVIATAANKTAPSGTGTAPGTLPTANPLYLATSQRDLIQNFGNPIFRSTGGTPLHGDELNEYGLHAAYSYLGVSNRAYVLRASFDLAQLDPSETAPTQPLPAGTYWFDLSTTRWGLFQSTGGANAGTAWIPKSVDVFVDAGVNVDATTSLPLASAGSDGDVCVVALTIYNLMYEKINGTWYQLGSTTWAAQHPTNALGTSNPSPLTGGNSFSINGVTVTPSGTDLASVVSAITAAAIPHVTASTLNNALLVRNTVGDDLVFANVSGSPLATLGLSVGTVPGISFYQSADAQYPAPGAAGSFWVKGTSANSGAQWVVRYLSATTGGYVSLTAPFYQYDSTITDGQAGKDNAALAKIARPAVGNLYIGFDPATGAQQIRRFNGSSWESLSYEADFTQPRTSPVDGTLWFDSKLTADIMVSTGSKWVGYRRMFPNTNAAGVQMSASPPTTQSDDNASALVDGDLWIDTSDTENYPVIYRFNTQLGSWVSLDNTDVTTPFGIVFGDARADSGPSFIGIGNASAYTYNSTQPADLARSDYVDPDAPNPELYPSGCLLFNTRFSGNVVKQWTPSWFNAGPAPDSFDPNTDFTGYNYSAFINNTQQEWSYTVGDGTYKFPPLAAPGRWLTVSGNRANNAPHMGRKAQRAVVVAELAAALAANDDIKSELTFFNLMAAPGYPELISAMRQVNISIKEFAFIVGDTPLRLRADGTSLTNWATNANNAEGDGDDGLTTSYEYAAVYYPWGLGTNIDGSTIAIPPSTIAMNVFAYNDNVAYQWFAPAGFQRGLVSNAGSVGYLDTTTHAFKNVLLNQGQRDVLYVNKINPIAYMPGRGLSVFGQKTLAPTDSALDRVNVARLANYLKYQLDRITKPFLFEPNDFQTRNTAKNLVDRFFASLVTLRGVTEYAVQCNESNNPPDRVARNELWIDCAVVPTKAVEFIYIPVRIVNQITQR